MSVKRNPTAVLAAALFFSVLVSGCSADRLGLKPNSAASVTPSATASAPPIVRATPSATPAVTPTVAPLAVECGRLKQAMSTTEARLQTVGDDLKSGHLSAADGLDDITGSLDDTVALLSDPTLKASAQTFADDVHQIASTLDDAVAKAKHFDVSGALADQKKALAEKAQATVDAQALHTVCAG